MAKILVVAEHSGGKLNPSTAKSVTCASKIPGAEIDVLVLAASAGDVAQQAASLQGVKRVLTVENAANAEPLAAVLAAACAMVLGCERERPKCGEPDAAQKRGLYLPAEPSVNPQLHTIDPATRCGIYAVERNKTPTLRRAPTAVPRTPGRASVNGMFWGSVHGNCTQRSMQFSVANSRISSISRQTGKPPGVGSMANAHNIRPVASSHDEVNLELDDTSSVRALTEEAHQPPLPNPPHRPP